MTIEQELDEIRNKKESTSPSIGEMNTLAEEIATLRDQEKELSDAKKEITEKLEAKEKRVTELLMENNLTSYKSPAGTLSVGFRTSVKLPQGENVLVWIDYLKKKYASLEGAIQCGMLSTNSARLNSFYKEEFELAKERGEDDFSIPGLTEVKLNPTLSFRRTR